MEIELKYKIPTEADHEGRGEDPYCRIRRVRKPFCRFFRKVRKNLDNLCVFVYNMRVKFVHKT